MYIYANNEFTINDHFNINRGTSNFFPQIIDTLWFCLHVEKTMKQVFVFMLIIKACT